MCIDKECLYCDLSSAKAIHLINFEFKNWDENNTKVIKDDYKLSQWLEDNLG